MTPWERESPAPRGGSVGFRERLGEFQTTPTWTERAHYAERRS